MSSNQIYCDDTPWAYYYNDGDVIAPFFVNRFSFGYLFQVKPYKLALESLKDDWKLRLKR